MKVIDINSMKSSGGEVATFQGFEHEAQVSFFIVQFSPGKGPRKHRHPYDEHTSRAEDDYRVGLSFIHDRVFGKPIMRDKIW